MLLIRGAPQIDESLSSFRQRIWQKNIYRIFPVFHPELRRSDPDLQSDPLVLGKVAEAVGLTEPSIHALTLWSLPLLRDQKRAGAKCLPRWVTYLQYARKGVGTGSQYCPICLSEGSIPYFKLYWRLSLSVSCPIHEVRMGNSCPHCGFPAWPYAAASAIAFFQESIALDQCPNCRGSLCDAPIEQETNSDILACIKQSSVEKGESLLGPPESSLAEQFAALRGVFNLAIHHRSRRKLENSEYFGNVIRALNREETRSTPFDRLDLPMRHDLLAAAWPVLRDWPAAFINFAKSSGISVVDFNEDRSMLPNWLLGLVESEFGQAGRYVTQSQVDAAVTKLKELGLPINKQQVSKLVGSLDAKAVRQLAKRTVASAEEGVQFAEGLERYMSSGPKLRKSSQVVRARNAIAVILATLSCTSFDDSVRRSWNDVYKILKTTGSSEPWVTKLLTMMERAVSIVQAAQLSPSGQSAESGFFLPHSGHTIDSRGPRQAFSQATRGIDENLLRRPSVFVMTRGMQPKTWTGLSRDSEACPVFQGTE
jgi:hypothetical protein